MSAWRAFAEPALDGYQVEWEEEGELLVSRRNELFRTCSPGSPLTPIGVFPASAWRSQVSRLRPAQRLLRFLYYNVLKLARWQAVRLVRQEHRSFGGQWRLRPDRGSRPPVPDPALRLRARARRKRVLRRVHPEPRSPRGHPHLSIRSGRGRLEIARRFPPGHIRHIHGIHADPYSDDLWCVSGDLDGRVPHGSLEGRVRVGRYRGRGRRVVAVREPRVHRARDLLRHGLRVPAQSDLSARPRQR